MRLPLLSLENGSREFHALAAIFDSRSQKQRTQMLFHGAGADVQLRGDVLVAASFDKQLENLFIALRNLDVAEIQHEIFPFARLAIRFAVCFCDSSSMADTKASDSPNFRLPTLRDKDLCLPHLLEGVSEL
jgi:hypothetical protein